MGAGVIKPKLEKDFEVSTKAKSHYDDDFSDEENPIFA